MSLTGHAAVLPHGTPNTHQTQDQTPTTLAPNRVHTLSQTYAMKKNENLNINHVFISKPIQVPDGDCLYFSQKRESLQNVAT